MKTIYLITDGVIEKNRNWGSKIDSIVENVLKKQDYEITTFYLTKDSDKSKSSLIKDNLHNSQIVSVQLNFLEKFVSWFLNFFTMFHYIENKKFHNHLKNYPLPDLIICMNYLAGYSVSNIKCKKILFVGQRQKNLYRTLIYNHLTENFFSGFYFLIKNISFYLIADISSIILFNKFSKVFFWSYYDFNFFKYKDKRKIFSYIENPVLENQIKNIDNDKNFKNNNYIFHEELDEENKFNLIIIGHLKATHQNEGLIYFFSKVKKELMKINFWNNLNIFIIGKFKPSNTVKKISNYKNVFFTGFVEEIGYFYKKADCNLLISTPDLGNRSRIAEFWLNKTPVVARLENIHYPHIIDNYNALIANTPKLIASKIKEVTTNKHLKNKIITNGYLTGINCFKLEVFQKRLKNTIDNI